MIPKIKIKTQPKKSANNNVAQKVDTLASLLKPLAKMALTSGGGALGSMLGGPAGGAVGTTIGARLSKIMGSGDYETNDCSVNSLFKGAATPYASFSSNSQGVTVKHRDYVGDVFTGPIAGGFSLISIPVNPGLSYFVPYLANIAQNFEEYRIRGMVFEYVSTTSPYTTGNSMGSVIMAAEYNSTNPPFTSKPQMENSDFALSVRLDRNAVYGIECAVNAQNTYYVRSGASVLPLTTTDLCTFYLATQPGSNFPINSAIGELWVSYDIEFMRPRVSPARFGYAHFYGSVLGQAGGYVNPGVACTNSVVYGSLTGVNLSSNGNGTFTLQFPNANAGDTYIINIMATLGRTSGVGSFTAFMGLTGVAASVIYGSLGNNKSSYAVESDSVSSFNHLATVAITILVEDEPGVIPTIQFAQTTTGLSNNVAATNYSCDITIVDVGNGYTASTL